MCGIVGIINRIGEAIDPQILKRMANAIRHRGPDGEGYFVHENVGFGHQRLAIIDLVSGQQPIHNENKTIWIVYNGEIYNFAELREQLQEAGHLFYTNTDTEVIVHAYEQYGDKCVTFLRGMFAFALWDGNQRKLLLARDRVGKKPLLYSHSNGRFIFASEFQAILQNSIINRDVDVNAIDQYLTHTYIPAPLTAFKEIKKLLPGHILIYQEEQIRIVRYWQLNFTPKNRIPEEEAAEHVLDLLTEAVKVRMRSDVPLGAFLSGGIDSSAVVGIMSQISDKPAKTFSIGFEETSYNELEYARIIAKRFGTDHHEFIVKPEALEVLPTLVRHYGEPYADSSAIPTFYVSQVTCQHVKVALSGDGGDELFAGYDRYFGLSLAARYAGIPAFLRRGVINPLCSLLPAFGRYAERIRQVKRSVRIADLPRGALHLYWLSTFRPNLKAELYSEEFRQSLSSADNLSWWEHLYQGTTGLDAVDAALYVDTCSSLPYDFLVKVDITSMANSLEVRSPFLEHALMEFAACLPSNFKLRGKTHKYILKKALNGFIPDENLYRSKMGFEVPVRQWLRNELRMFLTDILLSERSLKRGYFRQEFIEWLVKSHISAKQDFSYQVWTLLMLELWCREFID
jgi:asparagine synthase (glutamine-hydrolysing)